MSTRKRSLLGLGALAVSAGLVLSGCAGGGDTGGDAGGDGGNDGALRIGVLALATANTYAAANIEGAEMAAEADGNVELTVFDGEFSGATQLAQLQDAIATGQYDGFVIFPNDGVAIIPAVEEAAAEGLPIVAAYAPIGPDITTATPQVDGVIGTVFHPDKVMGAANGELVVQACKEEHPDANPCKVAYISGGNTVLFEIAKREAFDEVIKAADIPIEVVASQEGNYLIDASRTAAENILQANPDVNVIAATGDQMTYGVAQAVEDAGKTGTISLIGMGAAVEGVAAVKDGTWFGTTLFLPQDEGRIATEMLIKTLRGETVEQTEVNLIDLSPIGASFTRDTTEDFTPQWTVLG